MKKPLPVPIPQYHFLLFLSSRIEMFEMIETTFSYNCLRISWSESVQMVLFLVKKIGLLFDAIEGMGTMAF